MKGQLREHPLAELIKEISDAALSGALRLERQPAKAFVLFESGRVVRAATNLRAHRLSTLVWQWSTVAPERLATLGADGLPDEQMASALVAGGLVSQDEMDAVRVRQSEEALRHLLLWTDGNWAFNPQARITEGTHAPVDVGLLLLEAARRLPAGFVAARMRARDETLSPEGREVAYEQLQVEEGFVLSRIDARLTLKELVAVSGLPEEQTLRAVYALFVAGLVRREGAAHAFSDEALARVRALVAEAAKASPASAAASAQVTSSSSAEKAQELADPLLEIDALFSRADGATHYEVLGVRRSARSEEIKSAYYALAKRFHPDRFRRDADPEMFAKIEAAFGRVAKAYDVLKDPKLRAEYDAKAGRMTQAAGAAQPPRDVTSGGTATKGAGKDSAASGKGGDEARAESCFRQGATALESGDHKTAQPLLAEAAMRAPKSARYRAYYGRALAADRLRRRQAEGELQAAISLEPGNAEYRIWLAQLYADIGLRRRAAAEVERALSIDPNNAVARRLLRSVTRDT